MSKILKPKTNLKQAPLMKSGQAVITVVVLFLFISLTVTLGITRPVYREVKLTRDIFNSKESFFLSESGQEDVIYRLQNGLNVSNSESLTIGSSTVTTTILDESGVKIVTSNATSSLLVRKTQTEIVIGEGFSFNYGVQVGDGGLEMKNTSSVLGNVFTSGPIITSSNQTVITGEAISAGPDGLIEGMDVTNDAYANTIDDSEIGGDAYYQTITDTTVTGTEYPGSDDQATTSLPIPDSVIEDWKTQAEDGGVHTSPCPYDIKTNVTIGPLKINCDLDISSKSVVTIAGPIWVSGNIDVTNTATVRIDPSLGNTSIPIIAHNESDEIGSGLINIRNSAVFDGPNNNYILLVSMNNDAEEEGGGTLAVDIEQSTNGDLLVYAPHGLVKIRNSVNLKEVTAYKLELANSAQVVYDIGLVNLLFSNGPAGGGFTINSWQEVE